MLWNTVDYPRRLKKNMITKRCSNFVDLQMSRHHAYIPYVLISSNVDKTVNPFIVLLQIRYYEILHKTYLASGVA